MLFLQVFVESFHHELAVFVYPSIARLSSAVDRAWVGVTCRFNLFLKPRTPEVTPPLVP